MSMLYVKVNSNHATFTPPPPPTHKSSSSLQPAAAASHHDLLIAIYRRGRGRWTFYLFVHACAVSRSARPSRISSATWFTTQCKFSIFNFYCLILTPLVKVLSEPQTRVHLRIVKECVYRFIANS
jgi:hypothetical protein